ncbi:MAG: carbohydrate ABC transporter permease [Anaerolineae bacterium]|nr:carbohydrate ABC transporter permease [Anaerolineae bacterium]
MAKAVERIFAIVVHLLLVIGAAITVLPFLWMILSSFKTTTEIFRFPPALMPDRWILRHYLDLATQTFFPRWYGNSLSVAGISTLAVLFFSSLAGFGFGKYDFRGRELLFNILIASMIIPFGVVLIPLFVMVSKAGMIDKYATLIVPFMAPAFGIFMMKQFMASIPSELLDSARIDGAQEFGIYWRIVLPLLRPALGALTVYTFLGSWNSFLWPLVILRGMAHYTLPVGLATLVGIGAGGKTEYGMLLAGSTLVSLPVVTLFLLMQRQFIAGLTLGSVKE